jgi:hypothetical protein
MLITSQYLLITARISGGGGAALYMRIPRQRCLGAAFLHAVTPPPKYRSATARFQAACSAGTEGGDPSTLIRSSIVATPCFFQSDAS